MAWVVIASLKGAPGDAVAMGKFEQIDIALANLKNQIDDVTDDLIRTETIPNNQLVFSDALGADIAVIESLGHEPYLRGSNPPNSENIPASAGESFEVTDAYGKLLFAVDDMTSNPHFRGSTGTGFDETHFIFLVGQSNSVGIGTPSPVGTNDPLPNLYTIPQRGTSEGVEIRATDPLTHPYASPVTDSIGHGWTIARDYAVTHPNVRVVVIGLAKSGSGFWSPGDTSYSWAPSREGESGITSLYRNAINRANTAIAGYAGTKRVAMFVWHQGEGDAVGGTTQATYEAQMGALIKGFRSSITGASNAIFLIGQLGWEFRNVRAPGTWSQIDAAHKRLPSLVPATAFAPAPPQGHMFADNTHFTGLGQKLLAKSYIGVVQDALYNLPATYSWAGTAHESASIKKVKGDEVARNYALNPSYESSTVNWSMFSFTGTNTRTSGGAFAGNYFIRLDSTATQTGSRGLYRDHAIAVTSGQKWTASAWVRPSKTVTLTGRAEFRTATAAVGTLKYGDPIECPAGQWTRIFVTLTATGDATILRHQVYLNTASMDAGDTLDIDAEMVSLGELTSYFDGDTSAYT